MAPGHRNRSHLRGRRRRKLDLRLRRRIGSARERLDVEGLTLDLRNIERFPVAIGHGTYDPIIGVEWGRQARETLARAGVALHRQPLELER